MVNVLKGDLDATQVRVAIVVSRYNESITSKLLDGALETLAAAGVSDSQIDVAWVPGAWEIPFVASELIRNPTVDAGYDAVICLGAVIRGETTHDEHINRQVSHALGRLALDHRLPVLFGILTCNSLEQAIHRSGGDVGNKGSECASVAVEMMGLVTQIRAREKK